MRNNTFAVTVGILAVTISGAVLLIFPERGAAFTESVRHLIDKRPDMVRLEYIAAMPETVRGWQTLRVVQTGDQCLALMEKDYSDDSLVIGKVNGLRCVGYRSNGTMMSVIKSQWNHEQTTGSVSSASQR